MHKLQTQPRAGAARTRSAGGARAALARAQECAEAPPQAPHPRRSFVAHIAAFAALAGANNTREAKATPFEALLKEEELLKEEFLRDEELILAQRAAKEEEARATSQREALCYTPFGVDVVGVTETVALVGAAASGIAARRRKQEVELLNDKLRAINLSLRQQARAGIVVAPALNYAPPTAARAVAPPAPAAPAEESVSSAAAPETDNAATAEAPPSPPADSLPSPAPSTVRDEAREALRKGRQFLKSGLTGDAQVFFNKALILSRRERNRVQERRAMRGLAAAKRDLGDRAGAIDALLTVLAISDEIEDYTGDADALGTIADLHTETGNLEEAAKFYDRYMAALSLQTTDDNSD
mmetsp:Transcript_23989/g.77975  ORF Transcript_23989/g.77975 Transcript_23989/m.77975 type:complete len:355 (+) Transcript_23989:7173-8237(+)